MKAKKRSSTPARSTKEPHSNNTVLSPGAILLRSLGVATHVPLLVAQATVIILTLLALVLFTVFMGIASIGTALVLGITGWGVAAIGLGAVIWVIGIIGINVFTNGIQYHLAMQALSKKAIDISTAWKLSASRVGDAFVLQSILIIFVLILVGVGILPLLATLPFAGFSTLSATQLGWILVPILSVLGVLLILSPFLMLFQPIVFFEDAHPGQVIERARKYVKGNYLSIFFVLVGLVAVNIMVGAIADVFSGVLSLPRAVNERALVFVGFAIASFIIQAGATLYSTTFSLAAQTLLYLKVAKTPRKVTFVSKGAVSYALARVAGEGTRASDLPSSARKPKWKAPKSKKRR